MSTFSVYTDGGARGNPGPAAIGIVVKDETERTVHTISQTIGETTNNVAEYTAVVSALEWIKENNPITQSTNNPIIKFFLDSNLVVNQLNGLFKMKDAKLRALLFSIRSLEQESGGEISYHHIPREKNWEADKLVNQALDNTSMTQ